MLIQKDSLSLAIGGNRKERIEKLDRFPDDEPILGFEQINETLDDAEDEVTSNLIGVVWSGVDRYLASIDRELESLSFKKIQASPINLVPNIQGVLLNGWRKIFSLGSRDGISEINEVNLDSTKESPQGLFADESKEWASFAKDRSGVDKYIKRKPAFEVAYPPDQADLDVLDIEELREALELRTQVLASDVSQEISDRISRKIKDSIDLHYVEGREVQRLPKAARTKLLRQINGVINRERQRQAAQGEPLTRNQIRIPVSGSFVSRAKMIASTELNAGYNLGRLQSYYRSGVKQVRWQAIGDSRTCKICITRNGAIQDIDKVLKWARHNAISKNRGNKYNNWMYIIPAHPFCRCAWQVATKEEIEDKSRSAGVIGKKVTPLAGTWGSVAAAAGFVSKVGKTNALINKGKQLLEEKQFQEESKRKAANRARIALGGALSLGVLSFGLWSWLNKKTPPLAKTGEVSINTGITNKVKQGINAIASEEAMEKQVASALIKTQGNLAAANYKREQELAKIPITPEALMRGQNPTEVGWNAYKQKKYADFISSGVDLRTVSDVTLRTTYGLAPQDIQIVRGLQRSYQRNLTKTSPFQQLLPAAVVSPLTLAKYPWLAEAKDMREITVRDMLRRGIPEPEAIAIQKKIYKQVRSQAGVAMVSKEERRILRQLNSVETKEELAGLLQLPRNEKDIVNRVWAKKKRLEAQGKKFSSLEELRVLRGIGETTTARLLAEGDGKLRVNEVLMSSDKELGLERLKTITGVGDKTAQAIYQALLDTGTQFLDADDMIRRIEPYMRLRGIELSARVKKSLSNRIDFNYYPGLDRQTLPPGDDIPSLPGGDRRGDSLLLPTSSVSDNNGGQLATTNGNTTLITTENRRVSNPKAIAQNGTSRAGDTLITPPTQSILEPNSDSPSVPQAKLKAQIIKNRDKTQSRIDESVAEAIALGDNLEDTYDLELGSSKVSRVSRKSTQEQLASIEKSVSEEVLENVDTVRARQQQNAESLTVETQEAIADLESTIELGIENPLSKQVYDDNGRLAWTQKNRLNRQIRDIEAQIKAIDSTQDLPKEKKAKLKELKSQLRQVKKRVDREARKIDKNPLSATNLAKQRVEDKATQLLDEIESLPPEAVREDYDLEDRIDEINKQRDRATNPRSQLIERIDRAIEDLESVPDKILNNSDSKLNEENQALKQRLIAQRNELIGIRDRQLNRDELKTVRDTNAKRKLIAKQNREFKQKLNRFEANYLKLEAALNESRKIVIAQLDIAKGENLNLTFDLAVEKASREIEVYANRTARSQSTIDLLKSDRWQELAVSTANSEDLVTSGGLVKGNSQFVSFEELVSRRNQSLNNAAGEITRSATQVKQWANYPRDLVNRETAKVDTLIKTVESIYSSQNNLRSLGQELVAIASANPRKDATVFKDATLAKTARFEAELKQMLQNLKQAKLNIKKVSDRKFKLTLNGKQQSVSRVSGLADKAIARAQKRLERKDKTLVTGILDRVDKAGLNTVDFIDRYKGKTLTKAEQNILDNLSKREKRSLDLALDKGVLELNQQVRTIDNSRTVLNSLSNDLKERKRTQIKELATDFKVVGSRQARQLADLQKALKGNDIIKAREIANSLPSSIRSTIETRIDAVAEIVGDRSSLSQSEVNILAGVKPNGMDSRDFYNQVKGNLVNPDLYTLAEIEAAQKLNNSAGATANTRLSAVNFNRRNNMLKFIY